LPKPRSGFVPGTFFLVQATETFGAAHFATSTIVRVALAMPDQTSINVCATFQHLKRAAAGPFAVSIGAPLKSLSPDCACAMTAPPASRIMASASSMTAKTIGSLAKKDIFPAIAPHPISSVVKSP
jgi:hypothetical protein